MHAWRRPVELLQDTQVPRGPLYGRVASAVLHAKGLGSSCDLCGRKLAWPVKLADAYPCYFRSGQHGRVVKHKADGKVQVPLVLLEEGRYACGTLLPGHPAVAWLAAEMQAVLSAGVRMLSSKCSIPSAACN